VRSAHYFNVGLAVGDKGTIVRTMDGGYSWDCIRGCTRGIDLPPLNSISVNGGRLGILFASLVVRAAYCVIGARSNLDAGTVRLGGFGYQSAYYNAQGGSNVDGIDWTLLSLDEGQPLYAGLDGVVWPEQNGAYMEGFVVGAAGTIVRLLNAGVNGWDPEDLNNMQPDPKDLVEVTPSNVDGSGCQSTIAST
jgi:hypothetical protein